MHGFAMSFLAAIIYNNYCFPVSAIFAQCLQLAHLPLQQLQPVSPPSFLNALNTRFNNRCAVNTNARKITANKIEEGRFMLGSFTTL